MIRAGSIASVLGVALWLGIGASTTVAKPVPQGDFPCTPGWSLANENRTLSEGVAFIPPSGKVWDVTSYDVTGTGLAAVLPATGSYTGISVASTFAWSPDGTKVAYVGVIAFGEGPHTPSPLYVASTLSGRSRQLLPPSYYFVYDWSPDGRSILVGSSPDFTSKTLEIVDATTGTVRPLLENVESAKFSPDGRLIEAATRSGALNLIDVETGTSRVVAGGFGTFSPDSRQIAYWDASDGLVVTDAATGDRTVVAPAVPNPGSVLWAPDSRHLAYSAALYAPNTAGRYQIAITDLAERTPKPLGTALAPPIRSGRLLLWSDAASPTSGVVVTDMTTGRVLRTLNPIPPRLRSRYQPIPAYLIDHGTRLLYLVGSGGSTDGGYRTVDLTGKNDRPPFACKVDHGWIKVTGTPFDDVINVRNHSGFAYNTVTCGAGRDIVIADRSDRVGRDCEIVKRN